MVYYKPKWFSVTAVGLRNNRQKYKREMDKSSLKWNSLCEVQRHNLRHSDRIWREIRQNEVFATPSTRRLTQEQIISVASFIRLREPHSGSNLFHICLF